MILRFRHNRSSGQPSQRFRHQRRANLRQSSGKLRRRLLRANFNFALHQHVPGIHPCVDPHRRHAGSRFAVHDCPIDRRRASIFGQQGSVQVDPAQFRNWQQFRRDNLSVRDDHDAIGSQIAQQRLRFWVSNLFRLMHRQLRRQRRFLYRRKRNVLPSPSRTIRLRDHANNFNVRLCQQMFERGNRKRGCAAENDSHPQGTYHSPCFLSFLIFRLIRSRFNMLRCCKKRIPFK